MKQKKTKNSKNTKGTKETLSVRKVVKKRVKNTARTRINDMDQIYKLINKTQVSKKPLSFAVDTEMVGTIENIIKDLNMTFEIKTLKKKVLFKIYPNLEERVIDLSDVKELDDEILEEGQLF